MKQTFVIGIDGSNADAAAKGIMFYAEWLELKCDELASKLAEKGRDIAMQVMAGHVYSGGSIGSLHVESLGSGRYAIKAASEAILFLEFGTGIKGGGHPEPNGYGPGTYPGQKHALDPRGWWFPTNDERLIVRTDKNGQGWGHSYGNAPARPFYRAVTELEQDLDAIVREVFEN